MWRRCFALAILFVDVQSRRIDYRKDIASSMSKSPTEYCNRGENQNCACFKQQTCSSCTLPACPLQAKAFKARSMEEGLTGTAWRLTQDAGPDLIVKFESIVGAKSSTVAAQLGHQLGVPTPRALVVTPGDCPALFDLEHAKTLKQEFAQDVERKRVALLQEFVDGKTIVLPGCDVKSAPVDRSRPWVQVGIIAIFDWLIGKPDLFVDWQESFNEANPQNRHNIIAGKGVGAVDIDIQISKLVLMYKHDFENILHALTTGKSVDWIRANVLDVLDRTTFGVPSPAVDSQVQLGLLHGIRDVLEQSQSLRQVLVNQGGPVEILDMIVERITKEKADKLIKDLSNKVHAEIQSATAAAQAKGVQCCKVQCLYGSSWLMIPTKKKCSGGSHDGSFIVNEPMEGCDEYKKALTRTGTAVHIKCSPLCKPGKKTYVEDVTEVQRQSSCN